MSSSRDEPASGACGPKAKLAGSSSTGQRVAPPVQVEAVARLQGGGARPSCARSRGPGTRGGSAPRTISSRSSAETSGVPVRSAGEARRRPARPPWPRRGPRAPRPRARGRPRGPRPRSRCGLCLHLFRRAQAVQVQAAPARAGSASKAARPEGSVEHRRLRPRHVHHQELALEHGCAAAEATAATRGEAPELRARPRPPRPGVGGQGRAAVETGGAGHGDRPMAGRTGQYTLKRKLITSPSFTSYSLPSRRRVPLSRQAAMEPAATRSS